MTPTIVVHDVLQARLFSKSQLRIIGDKSMFDLFKEMVERLGNYKLKMVCIANGVDIYPKWVDLIKRNGWEVQLHGLIHHDMQHLTTQEIIEELTEGKRLLEGAFHQKITQFYPPRLKTSPWMYEACMKMGLALMMNHERPIHYSKGLPIPEVYIHYWNKVNVDEVVKLCHQQDEWLI